MASPDGFSASCVASCDIAAGAAEVCWSDKDCPSLQGYRVLCQKLSGHGFGVCQRPEI